MTADIVAFIRARLDEDQAIADRNMGNSGLGDGSGYPDYRTYIDDDTKAADDFIGHFAAARVLRGVEAKRRILHEHRSIRPLTERDRTKGVCATCAVDDLAERSPRVPWPCTTLRLLAAEFDNHQDYRSEWAV